MSKVETMEDALRMMERLARECGYPDAARSRRGFDDHAVALVPSDPESGMFLVAHETWSNTRTWIRDWTNVPENVKVVALRSRRGQARGLGNYWVDSVRNFPRRSDKTFNEEGIKKAVAALAVQRCEAAMSRAAQDKIEAGNGERRRATEHLLSGYGVVKALGLIPLADGAGTAHVTVTNRGMVEVSLVLEPERSIEVLRRLGVVKT